MKNTTPESERNPLSSKGETGAPPTIYTKAEITYRLDGDAYTVIKGESRICEAHILDAVFGIPVTRIAGYAFYDCKLLTVATIPDSVTTIEEEAFADCRALSSVTIGDGVTRIDKYAFWNCYELTDVRIPHGVESIGGHAFCHCRLLTEVVIPDSTKSIGNAAFYGCSRLSSVTIGCGVTSIDGLAFFSCKALGAAYFSVTEGWKYKDEPADPAVLADPATAAEWLRKTSEHSRA